MLVLTRKHQEKIRIGDHIVITVLKTKGKAVRLGIEAPMEVPVIRGELKFDTDVVANEVAEEALKLSAVSEPSRSATVDRKHTNRVRGNWPAKSEPVSSELPPGSAPSRVSFDRVSREQVSQLLTNKSDSAPLRAMLDRRSVSA
jgi:carbon storage regulator CsrA